MVQRRAPVIIVLIDPVNLKPGFEARVAIETLRLPDVLVISRTAAGNAGDGENIEALSGLSDGELVVLYGSMDLAEGAKVSLK
ncbi:MAG: hypothetical protein LRZ99_01750 [Desulfotomaculum sp.]|nr:hypothetical protein [Desulfotomaculum sp.]